MRTRKVVIHKPFTFTHYSELIISDVGLCGARWTVASVTWAHVTCRRCKQRLLKARKGK